MKWRTKTANPVQRFYGGGAGIPASPASSTEILSDSFFGLGVADATRKFLNMTKRPQAVPDIAKALEKGGFTHKSQNLTNTVGAVLHKIDSKGGDIRKVSRGVYGLTSWYGRKVSADPAASDG